MIGLKKTNIDFSKFSDTTEFLANDERDFTTYFAITTNRC